MNKTDTPLPEDLRTLPVGTILRLKNGNTAKIVERNTNLHVSEAVKVDYGGQLRLWIGNDGHPNITHLEDERVVAVVAVPIIPDQHQPEPEPIPVVHSYDDGEAGDWNPFASLSYSTSEIPDLVDWLLRESNAAFPTPFPDGDHTVIPCKEREVFDQLIKAAYLLKRLAPQPIPVSERLPGPRDCAPWPSESDSSAWCWVGSDVDGGWGWEQRSAGCLQAFPDDYTHWLPAHALPLPSEEVQ